MQFGPTHYVSVLKIKDNEKRALVLLGAAHASKFTPLLEVVERKGKSLADHIDTTFKRLANSVEDWAGCFLDARELSSDGDPGAEAVFSRADSEGINYVPVVGLTRTAGNRPALKHAKNGVALRLTREELEADVLPGAIPKFLNTNSLDPGQVDLIMDMGDVGMLIAPGVFGLAQSFLGAVPHHKTWRTFTLSGCAFPKSMGKVGRDSFLLVNRTEWIGWRDGLYVNRGTLKRLPTFSDCAIQHPSGVEGFNPLTMAVSAAARHASGDSWLLVKGESTRNVSPSVQYRAIAKKIVSNAHGQHFLGATHCAGCADIEAAAKGAPGLGGLGVWRRIGTTHHVATVLKDLSALHWP
jgi:hypothetical protein